MDLANLLPAIESACRLDALRGRLAAAREPVVLGVSDAAKPALVAALARTLEAPALVVVPKPPDALTLVEELTAWLGGSLPVLSFPERDTLPYERLPRDVDAVRERLATLDTLRQARPCIVVAPAGALAQRTLSPAEVAEAHIEVARGSQLSPDRLVGDLLRVGFQPLSTVTLLGQVARRGGIVDVWAPTHEAPLRIEFFGDEVESLRRFDPETQRSADQVESATFGPGREALGLAAAIEALAGKLDLAACKPEIAERFEEELARLAQGEWLPDEGFYLPFVARGTLLEHLPGDGLLVVSEAADAARAAEERDSDTEEARADLESRGELPAGLPSPHVPWPELDDALRAHGRRLDLSRFAAGAGEDEGAPGRAPFAPPDAYGGRLRELAGDLAEAARRGRATVVVSQQASRVAALLDEAGVPATVSDEPAPPQPGAIVIVHGSLANGWRLNTAAPPLTLLTDSEVYGFAKQRRRLPRRSGTREAFLAELTVGEFVVHIEHGIGRFDGVMQRRIDGVEREYLELRYADGDRLYVPVDQVDRVSRYVGPGDHTPSLTRLGSHEWARAKSRARKAVAILARDLLELYASRQLAPGHAFPTDVAWQQELEASFPYVETPDQLQAVHDVKVDMERPRPMDRLVCGDVGYGKTEVAVRAAFKAVLDGSQVAILVPTTVLAQQHFTTFRERLAGFPARVEMLSRFRSAKEQRAIVEDLAKGGIDIVIGTHRLLQKDVQFKNLGLVIIDEEQRFGVGHKERLKQMRREVDVLTLSATPIPRTLQMSLSGIRDMSTMETPPEDRLPIKTYVAEYDDRLVREAILRELERGGQVYFVHNRVHDIERITSRLRDLVPEAEFTIAHGQQHEDALEQAMLEFVEGKHDVLVCTTIIESGLDIPNVNTMIIDRADRLGLAQIYQLRGRVGRGAARAYAYLLYERSRALTEPAQKRLQAIFEATELGAGFQIALRDLEIRGAGNLLGAEQSGQIGAVGFELYVRLLADEVERLKAVREGRKPPVPKTEQAPATIDLPMSAYLPATYVEDLNVRLALYQRMAAVESAEAAEALGRELLDRFGQPPPAAQNLLFAVQVRALLRHAGARAVQQESGDLVVHAGDGVAPRERLRGLDIEGLWLGPTQARLKLDVLGEGWRDALVTVLAGLAAAQEAVGAAN